MNEKHSLFKLFMNDTGLLCAACMDNIQVDDKVAYLPWYMVMFIRNQQIPKGFTFEVDISELSM